MLHMAKQSLAEFIKTERDRRGLSLRRFAELSGVSFGLIGKIERGDVKMPNQEVLEGLAAGLSSSGAPVSYGQLDRIARGVDEEPSTQHQAMDPEVANLAQRILELPPETRKRYIRMLEEQIELMQGTQRPGPS